MPSGSPREGDGLNHGRGSNSQKFRASISTLPRPQASLRESRFRASQPAHSLLTGGDVEFSRPSSRHSYADSMKRASRESSKENMAPPDAEEYEKYRKEAESLKAEIGTLQYRLQTSDQEKEIALSQLSNKVEQAQRAEDEANQKRAAVEASQAQLMQQLESLKQEVEQAKESSESEQVAADRALRQAQDEVRLLHEQLEDLQAAKDDATRISERKANDANVQVASLQRSLEELGQEAQSRENALQQAQSQVTERDDRIAEFEAEVLRLKAQGGDAETMAAIKKELTEQVHHIRKLEVTNRDQLSELKHLRSVNRAVEVVEEEKRSLQRKLDAAAVLEAELEEARIQRQRLEDERLAWTSYLESASDSNNVEFDSPEALARAFVHERLTAASRMDQVGALQAELSAQQNTVRSLEGERAQLRQQVEEAKSAAGNITADKARSRLDRQRALAVKEVEYLRAQLKTFDVEDETMQPEQYDQARAQRIQELEDLVDQQRKEMQTLHTELASVESSGQEASPQVLAGNKRARPDTDDTDDTDEQLGQLTRKNRKLQEEVTTMQTQLALLEKDLAASREQLKAAKEHSSTRILSLRSNPTSDHEKIKQTTLDALQKENQDLLALLQSKKGGEANVPLIPTSVLGAMEREIAAAKAETASAQKSARRLKEVWGSKSHEFKEAIFSTLGWTVTFIPNGKMRVESTFYPSQTDENENSIVFDGERGTMKVGGGPKSAFARKISDQIGFWVREKGCIPGFLAALTLEFYEEHSRAARP
ncbi:mitotic checkpoint protein [Sarocladium implicatum]|nr:mitotic checkpoint protein [Sarocladium implicatum]